VRVTGLTDVTALSAGGGHSLALRADGTLWSWGRNDHGQLGDGSFDDRMAPVQAANLDSITSVAAGGLHSVALKADGSVWTWGWNYEGQLGVGTVGDPRGGEPIRLQAGTPSGTRAVVAGGAHTLALLPLLQLETEPVDSIVPTESGEPPTEPAEETTP
jgi:hypothetical protein